MKMDDSKKKEQADLTTELVTITCFDKLGVIHLSTEFSANDCISALSDFVCFPVLENGQCIVYTNKEKNTEGQPYSVIVGASAILEYICDFLISYQNAPDIIHPVAPIAEYEIVLLQYPEDHNYIEKRGNWVQLDPRNEGYPSGTSSIKYAHDFKTEAEALLFNQVFKEEFIIRKFKVTYTE